MPPPLGLPETGIEKQMKDGRESPTDSTEEGIK